MVVFIDNRLFLWCNVYLLVNMANKLQNKKKLLHNAWKKIKKKRTIFAENLRNEINKIYRKIMPIFFQIFIGLSLYFWMCITNELLY